MARDELEKRYRQLEPSFTADFKIRTCIRINTIKISPEKLVKRLEKKKVILEKADFLECGYFCRSEFSLGATPEYLQGLYYLQEAASQIPVQLLDPKPGEEVLDMSAAPGSKTTQIAQKMDNKGIIVALDNKPYRLKALANNLERMGAKNCAAYKKDARFAFDLGKKFDKILLDAECSGNFAAEKSFFDRTTLQTIKMNAKIQKELLRAAVKCLRENGILVYSTCSLEPEENEMVIDWLLSKYKHLRLEKIDFSIGDSGITNPFGQQLNTEVSGCLRLWPHKTNTQGFFVAKIVAEKEPVQGKGQQTEFY